VAAGDRLVGAALRGATILGTVPHQHSYGIESTVLLALQNSLVIDADRPFYPSDISAALAAAPRPRILVTTPVHLHALLAAPDSLPPADLVVSATEPLTAHLAAAAEARFRAPLIESWLLEAPTRHAPHPRDGALAASTGSLVQDGGTWAPASGPVETRLAQ
jgi:acyl-coenzyme A synthetase/AMP-(fatty) acid ligase